MLARLLVPIDGSECAARALPLAAELARRTAGRVVLVHVARSTADGIALDDALGRVRAFGALAEAIQRTVGPGEEVADALLTAAREADADLLVMSTHGRGALGRTLLGSVADRVLRLTDRPVLLVPPLAETSWPPVDDARVLVALDGSRFGEQVIAPAEVLATALRADVVLASVVVPPPVGWGYFEDPSSGPFGYNPAPALATTRRYLAAISGRLASGGTSVRIRTEVGDAAATLVRLAAEEHARVLALATHGYGGLARVVLGSVAAELVRCAAVPLLVVRSVAAPDPTEVSA